MTRLRNAAILFLAAYHARGELVAGQAAWNCVIALQTPLEKLSIAVVDGRATIVEEAGADIVVSASEDVMIDVLELRRDPSAPYLFGELAVRGPEKHFMRLDYVVSALASA